MQKFRLSVVIGLLLTLFAGAAHATPFDVEQARVRVAPASGGVGGLTCDATIPSNEFDTGAEVQTWLNINGTVAGTSGDPYVYCLPAGQVAWTTGITWTMPAYTILLGAGSLTTQGGGDATIILDDILTNTAVMSITSSGNARLAGFTVRGRDGARKENGTFNVYGGTIRIDHVHFDTTLYTLTPASGDTALGTGKVMWIHTPDGVLDSSIFDVSSGVALYYSNGAGASGQGNETWAAATANGSNTGWFYVEDNLWRQTSVQYVGRFGDMFGSSKVVWRFNTIQGSAGMEVHSTGSTGDSRGARAQEGYNNYFLKLAGTGDTYNPPRNLIDVSNGTALVWGNVVDPQNLKEGFIINRTRRDDATYPIASPPDGWGYHGSPLASGTVNVTDSGGGLGFRTVTLASGSNFSTSWTAGTTITINGAVCNNGGAQGAQKYCRIASVGSTGTLTLQTTAGSALTGATFTVGSAWDGNTNANGYPFLDGTGRGPGSLITGSFSLLNKGIAGVTGAAYPNQALEPVYSWNITFTPHTGWGGSIIGGSGTTFVSANVDYYLTTPGGANTTPTSPFNGTTGTGYGPVANRPTTCTTGVVYWATDQGSWNQSTSNAYGVQQNGADGKAWKCTNAGGPDAPWTAGYGDNVTGEPYTYPHPRRAL